jgi:hypothetical protein
MGEAKRRQSAATQTTQYYDLGADELRPAKVGGDPEVLIRRMARREFPPVPCDGCVECCYHTRVEVDPDLERPEDLAYLATEPDPEGGLRLRKRSDGACIHLGSRGIVLWRAAGTIAASLRCLAWAMPLAAITMRPPGRFSRARPEGPLSSRRTKWPGCGRWRNSSGRTASGHRMNCSTPPPRNSLASSMLSSRFPSSRRKNGSR